MFYPKPFKRGSLLLLCARKMRRSLNCCHETADLRRGVALQHKTVLRSACCPVDVEAGHVYAKSARGPRRLRDRVADRVADYDCWKMAAYSAALPQIVNPMVGTQPRSRSPRIALPVSRFHSKKPKLASTGAPAAKSLRRIATGYGACRSLSSGRRVRFKSLKRRLKRFAYAQRGGGAIEGALSAMATKAWTPSVSIFMQNIINAEVKVIYSSRQ